MPVIQNIVQILHISARDILAAILGLAAIVTFGLVDRERDSHHGKTSHQVNQPSLDATDFRRLIRTSIDDARNKDSPGDELYFANGIWHTGRTLCVRCDMGPGIVAAGLGSLESDNELIAVAIETVDSTIHNYRADNGALGVSEKSQSPDLETMFTANQIGLALYVLKPWLDDSHKKRWTKALRDAVDFLIKNGNYAWYTNGNVTLGNAMVAALAWTITEDPKYRLVYTNALTFAGSPSTDLWPDQGMVYTRYPLRPDGADGAAYLTEKASGGKPGFDADYTQVQADTAAMIYLMTNDPQALRMANLLVNQILPKVNRERWTLDTSGGTRHPEQDRHIPFSTNALVILADRGREDLKDLVNPQVQAMARAAAESGRSGDYHTWPSQILPTLITLR